MIRVTVWNEFLHEKIHEEVIKVYSDGIHNAIARGVAADGIAVRTATLDEPEHGLTEEALNETDVQVIRNAVRWAAPAGAAKPVRGNVRPLEPIKG